VTTGEFLSELRQRDIEVWLEGDRVRCSAPPGALTGDLRDELTRRRDEIVVALRSARDAASSAIVPIERGGSRRPFYAVPGHNGDVFCFVPLARELGPAFPFFGLQPPGLRDGTQPLRRIEDLAAFFVDELVRRDPGPYQIGGYCLGGLTAFEMARQLEASGRDVRLLVLFGTTSPTGLRAVNRVRGTAAYWLKHRAAGARAFLAASPRDRAAKIADKMRGLGRAKRRAAPGGAEEFEARRLAVESATLEAAYRYRPRPYGGRITFFAANQAATRTFDRPLAWAAHAVGGLDLFCGPADCDGDSMLRDPSARAFATRLADRMVPPSVDASWPGAVEAVHG